MLQHNNEPGCFSAPIRRLAPTLAIALLCGCMSGPTAWYPPYYAAPAATAVPVAYANPVLIPVADYHVVWEAVVDIVDDYFRVEHEEPIRVIGNSLTEGRLETYPKPGATLLEPWDHDSANPYERLESTLQSIRRRAMVRVLPAQTGGFWVEVAVLKELENMAAPEYAAAGISTFRTDQSLTRVINPDRTRETSQGWVPQGRDAALEQRIIAQIQYRLTPAGQPTVLP